MKQFRLIIVKSPSKVQFISVRLLNCNSAPNVTSTHAAADRPIHFFCGQIEIWDWCAVGIPAQMKLIVSAKSYTYCSSVKFVRSFAKITLKGSFKVRITPWIIQCHENNLCKLQVCDQLSAQSTIYSFSVLDNNVKVKSISAYAWKS